MKLIILIGLPASGKTMWAKNYEKSNPNCKHIEFDKVCIIDPIYYSYENAITGELTKWKNYNTIIFDFMFYSNHIINETIGYSKNYNITEVELRYWIEDKKMCLYNDRLRAEAENRKFTCERTIKNRKIERPDIDYLKSNYQDIKFSLIEHEVYNPFLLTK